MHSFSCAIFLLLIIAAAGKAQTKPPESPFISYLIESAQTKIKNSPAAADSYSDLAFGLARRARETEDPRYWKQAEQAITTALKLDPRNFEARKARVMIRVQQGRLADADEEGVALNKQTPDDNPIYGLLVDSALARGKYSVAESLTQRMLDLRQVNGPGLQRAAQVREVIGFPEGALDFWMSALRLASTGDTEERAHILTQLAGLSRRWGKTAEAERYAAEALKLEPEYPAALIEQARILLDDGKPLDAIASIARRLQENENLAARYWNAVAAEAAGQTVEAKVAAARFLADARTFEGKPGNRDDLLIRYLTTHQNAKEAVRIGEYATQNGASLEMRDAYALALLEAGDPPGARREINHTLEPGIKNPQYFLDAAKIYRLNSNLDQARVYLKNCIEVNGSSKYATVALRELQNTANPERK